MALRASQGAETRTRGLCGCTSAPCGCGWARLIDRMETIGYRLDQRDAVLAIPGLMAEVSEFLARTRRDVLSKAAQEWQGNVKEFLEHYKLTRVMYDRLGLRIKNAK